MEPSRRAFLEQVGQGVLLASVGPALTSELGLASARAADGPTRLNFGKREPLVELIQKTPPDKILPLIVERLNKGTDLKDVVAAAALANARNFGGENYVGYHTMMALAPSYAMSRELPTEKQALPVLKVLYRNCGCIASSGGHEVLLPVEAAPLDKEKLGGEVLRDQARNRDKKNAEAVFASLAKGDAKDAFNHLLYAVDDDTEVHRVVLAYRSYDMLSLVGTEHAHTLLRQSVRYCVDAEQWNRGRPRQCRTVLPKMLDKHKLLDKTAGTRKLDDDGIRRLSENIFKTSPEQAAGLAAEALADGILPDDVGEAITLAACELLLRDDGRPMRQTSAGKPIGSVHGDSIGLHATDSANAWRNIAAREQLAELRRVLDPGRFPDRPGSRRAWRRFPQMGGLSPQGPSGKGHRERCLRTAPRGRGRHQGEGSDPRRGGDASVSGTRLSRQGRVRTVPPLRHQRGRALHAEKFYRTVREEHGRGRAAFRGRYLVALARVTASAYGQPAPGIDLATRLLKV